MTFPFAFGCAQYFTPMGLQGIIFPDAVFIQRISAPHDLHFAIVLSSS